LGGNAGSADHAALEVVGLSNSLSGRATRLERYGKERTMTVSDVSSGFYRVDAEWRMIAIDAAAQHYLGLSAEEALGRTLWDIAPGLLGTACERHYRQAMANGQAFEFVGPSVVRHGHWLEVKLMPATDGLVVSLTDITEHVQRPLVASTST